MEKQVNGMEDEPVQEPQKNAGWFRPGDSRINKQGRPRGSPKAAAQNGSPPADLAPCADRLNLLVLPIARVKFRLTHKFAFFVVNLPGDFDIVASRVDCERGRILYTIRSQEFPRVAKGAPIPEFAPRFDGLKFH